MPLFELERGSKNHAGQKKHDRLFSWMEAVTKSKQDGPKKQWTNRFGQGLLVWEGKIYYVSAQVSSLV